MAAEQDNIPEEVKLDPAQTIAPPQIKLQQEPIPNQDIDEYVKEEQKK